MINVAQYREALYDAYWLGKGQEMSEEQRADAAAAAIGKEAPQDAMAEARAMYETAKARSAPSEEVASPEWPKND